VDNFVNILPGDEELELEEDVMSELGDSDEEIDPSSPADALASTALSRAEDDYDSDDVSVLRMNASSLVPPPPPCSSLTVNLVKALATPPMDVVLSFGGIPIHHQAIPDSGAGASIVSLALVEKHGWKPFPCSIPLKQADGAPLPVHGALYLDVEYLGLTISAGCFVSPALQDGLLLSWFHMRDLGLLTDRFPGITTPSICAATLPEDSMDAIKTEFSDVLSDSLAKACGRMKGDPVHLELLDDPSVKPCHVKTARQVNIHHRDAAKDLLDELLEAGVIQEVDIWTEWISPAFFVEKPGTSKVRLVTDYRQLNRCVKRPIHPFSPATDLIKRVDPEAKWFCKLDAVHGYFQIPLGEPSSLLTTFLLPSGRYRYNGAHMGLSSSSDWFNHETDKAVFDLLALWLLKIVDDMLVQARTLQLLARVRIVLQRCRNAGITISIRKLAFGQSISFAGFVISSEGIRPDPEKICAILEFPIPTNPSEVRSFLGLANQLAFFIPDVAKLSSAIRALLKKGVAYQWLPAQQTSFEALKSILTSDMCVRPFDVSLPTEVLTDASRLHGIGYAILQRDAAGLPRLISCGSRSLTSAEKNYATVELELLAIWWACSKSVFYLKGIELFSVITDHKPLVGLMQKPLEDILNPRLQRFREKLMGFNLEITWTEGKSHLIADALSRAPVADSVPICQVGLGSSLPLEDEFFSEQEMAEIMVRAVAVPAMVSIRASAKIEPYASWVRDFSTGNNHKKVSPSVDC